MLSVISLNLYLLCSLPSHVLYSNMLDAMEQLTPVSALIHAAIVVIADVF